MDQPTRSHSPLARRSSGEQIADQLRRQILDGQLGPGQRLTQEDIAAQLGTSRVPVREALVILEQEGWVKMEMHRGGFVLPIQTSVADNAEIWELVFGLVVRRVVDRMTPDVDARLATIAADLTAADDGDAICKLCELYLDVLFDAASAPALARTVRRSRATAIDTIFDHVPDALEIIRSGTLAVIAAVRAGNGKRAIAAHSAMQKKCLSLLMKAFDARS